MNTGRAKKIRKSSSDLGHYEEVKRQRKAKWMKANVPRLFVNPFPKRNKNQSTEAFKEKRRRVNERKRKSRMGIGYKKTAHRKFILEGIEKGLI